MEPTPFHDRDGIIWYDGEFLPWRDAKVHVLTHALHYASSVFEGERVYNGRVFKLNDHTERLANSAKILGFSLPFTVADLNQVTKDLLDKNGITDGYVRPVAWRGSEQMGVAAQKTKIHVAIACWEWPSYFSPELRDKGIRLCMSSWRRPAPDTAPTNAKAAGLYMICTIAKHQAENQGFQDALMLDYRGQIAESTGANFFMVKEGKLYTPTPDCFLDGITRRTVIGLAKKRGIEVIEGVFWPKDLETAEEMFLTGTAAEVTAVGEVDGHVVPVGPITKMLRADYEQLVREPV